MSENTIARIMTHMLPTRPASGLTCPSFVFVPQAQHALQTPSQQAQAAQHASEATQPIFFCAYARRRRAAKMRLVLWVSWRPQGCVFSAEDVKEQQQAIPEGCAEALTAHDSVKQRLFFGVWSLLGADGKCATRSKHVPGVLKTSQETSKQAKKQLHIVRVPHPFYKSRAGRRADAGTRDYEDRTADLLRARSSQQRTC